jgi:Dockerin type I domain
LRPSETQKPTFQNAVDQFDVDGSGEVSAIDALHIINFFNRRELNAPLDPNTESPNGICVDVNGDNNVTANDALQVINEMARRQRLAEVSNEQRADVEKADSPKKDQANTIAAQAINDAVIAQLF